MESHFRLHLFHLVSFHYFDIMVEWYNEMVEGCNMSLNIKNEETYRMVHELAALTGESMTAAVREAVRDRLERVRQEQNASLAERLVAIGRDCASRLQEPFLSFDHGDLLYDERGLPK
jgi:antitoxin VapB